MSILFVLLTFLLILAIMYFRRLETPAADLQPTSFQKVAVTKMLRTSEVQVPQEYAFHPGHTWIHDEGHQNARVGIDALAGNLFGRIDGIEVAELNRWVRQGQKLCTIKHGEKLRGHSLSGRGRRDLAQPRGSQGPQPHHQRSISQGLDLCCKGF